MTKYRTVATHQRAQGACIGLDSSASVGSHQASNCSFWNYGGQVRGVLAWTQMLGRPYTHHPLRHGACWQQTRAACPRYMVSLMFPFAGVRFAWARFPLHRMPNPQPRLETSNMNKSFGEVISYPCTIPPERSRMNGAEMTAQKE